MQWFFVRTCLLPLAWVVSAHAAAPFIAGSVPDRRPPQAPVLSQYAPDPFTVQVYLHGIAEPVPTNVAAAIRSGPWYMPLRSPGMAPPYDIRGWFPSAPKR